MTQHPEEGTLHAYIDGELSAVEAAALEAHVAGCASCGAALAEARGFVAAASRAISALDVAPSSARPTAPPSTATVAARQKIRPPVFRVPYARAAALLLLVGGTALVLDRSGTLERGGVAPTELLTTDEAMPVQAAPTAAPEPAASVATSNTSTRPVTRDAAARSAALSSKTVASTGAAAGVAADAAARDTRAEERAPAPAATAASPEGQGVASIQQRKQPTALVDSVSRFSAPVVVPAAPPPARMVETRLSDLAATGTATASARVTRYRTKEGAILTLTEEPLRTSSAEEAAAARRTAAPPVLQRGSAQAAQAAMAAPVVNSYRWTSVEQGRSYTLTGALSLAELEALSKRLTELERLP